jgi:polyhydroxyalkanoate synthesis repressor PhaR
MEAKKKDDKNQPVVIKKYANRRLYDTETSAYITLEDLCDRVKKGTDFIVVDAKTGQDLTRQVLTQIIFEQETKGSQILPTDFLRSVIRFYDGQMQGVLQQYLNASMKTFSSNQERMQSVVDNAMSGAMGGFNAFKPGDNPLEEITRQNMALFEKAMTMFTPFGGIFGADSEEEAAELKKAKR